MNVFGERSEIRHGFPSIFSDGRYSTTHPKGGLNNHFQGVQRLGQYLLVTGSFPHPRKRADLLVGHLGTRPSQGPWGSNLRSGGKPKDTDRLEAYFKVDPRLWHAGGLGIIGTTAVVPLEGDAEESIIRFVDLGTPASPEVLEGPEFARADRKAGACAITSLKNKRLLLAVLARVDERQVLDLYRSDPGKLDNFRLLARFTVPKNHDFDKSFQSFDFVWTKASNGVEQLFVVAFENTGSLEPLGGGDDLVRLFKVRLGAIPRSAPSETAANPKIPELGSDFLTQMGRAKALKGGGKEWFNLDAGGSVYVDDEGRLIFYAVHHYLQGALRFVEFRSTLDLGPIAKVTDAWVELYGQKGVMGPRLAIFGSKDPFIEDSDDARIDTKTKLKKVASIRAQIPPGTSFALYPKKDFRGSPALVIAGDGRVRTVGALPGEAEIKFRSGRFIDTELVRASTQLIV